MMPLNLRAPILPPNQIELPLTVRRLTGGGLNIYAGEYPIKGVAAITIADDGERSVMTVHFNCADIFFDTEPVKADVRDHDTN